MEYLPLTILLLGVLLLTMAFAHLQHRYYQRVVNHLAGEYRGPGRALVSGISRGRLRGAIAILVVQRDTDMIERALVMEGSSILARFREQPGLSGQPLEAITRVSLSRPASRALQDAAARYRQFHATAEAASPSADLPTPVSLPAEEGAGR